MSSRKGRAVQKWDPKEDVQLTKVIVSLQDENSWDVKDICWRQVSARMPGRSTKQCRERYYNVLDPTIVRSPWRADELDILFRAHTEVGNSWQEIAKRIPGRSESQVKNVYYSAVRRAQREAERLGRDVPPSFIVQQTAEREAKTGKCSLPSAISQVSGSPALAPMYHTSPGLSGMVPTPHTSPSVAPEMPPAHALPAAALTLQSASRINDDSNHTPDANCGSVGDGDDGEEEDADMGAMGAVASQTAAVASGGPAATSSILSQMHAAQVARLLQMQQAQSLAVQSSAATSHTNASCAMLPVVVPNGIRHQSVHVYRRKPVSTPSPLGAPQVPVEMLGHSAPTVVPPPALHLSAAVHHGMLAPLPSTDSVADFSLDGEDGDVDLDQANSRIDSWLRPQSGSASPHAGLSLMLNQGSLARNASSCSQQMFVAGTSSPSFMLAGAGRGLGPLASPSALFASSSPKAQTVRVG